jgi:hypothetical protein
LTGCGHVLIVVAAAHDRSDAPDTLNPKYPAYGRDLLYDQHLPSMASASSAVPLAEDIAATRGRPTVRIL